MSQLQQGLSRGEYCGADCGVEQGSPPLPQRAGASGKASRTQPFVAEKVRHRNPSSASHRHTTALTLTSTLTLSWTLRSRYAAEDTLATMFPVAAVQCRRVRGFTSEDIVILTSHRQGKSKLLQAARIGFYATLLHRRVHAGRRTALVDR